MPRFLALLILLALTVPAHAATPSQLGNWLMVNGVLILEIRSDGTMQLRNTGESGRLELAEDGTFVWELSERKVDGRITGDRLLLRNTQAGAPRWVEFIEFRRADKDATDELIEFALRQQTAAMNALAKVQRSAIERTILNNLRQLSAAADQHFLEYGTDKVHFSDLVGEGKLIRMLESVDGEDYSTLDLTQSTESWTIVSATGVSVTYRR